MQVEERPPEKFPRQFLLRPDASPGPKHPANGVSVFQVTLLEVARLQWVETDAVVLRCFGGMAGMESPAARSYLRSLTGASPETRRSTLLKKQGTTASLRRGPREGLV